MDSYTNFAAFFEERLKHAGITAKELSQETVIAVKHIEALRGGRYEDLPAAPYLHGYLVKISHVLNFDAEEWWERIKTEAGLQRSGPADILPPNRFVKKMPRSPWIIGATLLLLIVFVIRLPFIIGSPKIVIAFPNEEIVKTRDPQVRVAGTAENANALYINGERIMIRTDGTWNKELLLQPGLNAVEVRAKKLLGRETRIIRQIFYEETPLSAPTGTNTTTTEKVF